MAIELPPWNDKPLLVYLSKVNSSTGAVEPLTTGTIDHFIGTSSDPAVAGPADPAFVGTATYTGQTALDPDTQTLSGVWLVQYDATIFTPALLASLFANAQPILILKQTGGFWAYIPLKYVDRRKGTVV